MDEEKTICPVCGNEPCTCPTPETPIETPAETPAE
jgi:hypothetical protein